jgi:hypothetical protein
MHVLTRRRLCNYWLYCFIIDLCIIETTTLCHALIDIGLRSSITEELETKGHGDFANSRLALKQYNWLDLTEMHLLSSISKIDRYEVVGISEQNSLF